MKKYFLILLLFPLAVLAQIDIEEMPEKEISKVAYDGSFPKLPIGVKDEVALGLIDEKVTLLEVSYLDVKLENGDRTSYEDEKNFKNKTYEIVAYEKDIYPTYTIRSELGTYKWKVSSSSKYVFNKYLDVIKDELNKKVFVPLHNINEVESLNGTKVNIDGSKEYTITKVSFTKFMFDYGVKVTINDDFELKYPTGDYDQPRNYNGEKFAPTQGWINLKGDGVIALDNILIEKEVFKTFTAENANYIEQIRAEKIKIGMTNQQCRWAWGNPQRSLGSVAGYDEVFDWGGKTLYFKDNKLAQIR